MIWSLILAALIGTAIMFLIDLITVNGKLANLKVKWPYYALLFVVTAAVGQFISYSIVQFIMVVAFAVMFIYLYQYFTRKTNL